MKGLKINKTSRKWREVLIRKYSVVTWLRHLLQICISGIFRDVPCVNAAGPISRIVRALFVSDGDLIANCIGRKSEKSGERGMALEVAENGDGTVLNWQLCDSREGEDEAEQTHGGPTSMRHSCHGNRSSTCRPSPPTLQDPTLLPDLAYLCLWMNPMSCQIHAWPKIIL